MTGPESPSAVISDGITDLSIHYTEAYLGGVEAFAERQRVGMRETLEQLKAEAER